MAKGSVVFREDVCKGCGLCVSVCPAHILELDEAGINKKGYHPIHLTNPDRCSGCAICALMCPDAVITVYRDQ